MLKVINTACGFDCNNLKSKCAEIHYQFSTFSILCIFCDMKTVSFSEFCQHFNKHYEEFINELPVTEVLTINNEGGITNFNCKHDPLKLELADLTNDTEVRTTNEDAITVENKIIESATGSQLTSLQDIIKDQIKVEDVDVTNKATTQTYLVDCSQHGSISGNENTSETDSYHTDSKPTESNTNESVDWTKSYEPNLLKNSDKRPYKARNTPNMCTYCGKTFRRRLQLDTHLNIHTGSKPHQCEICGRQFRAVTTLARHRNTHQHRTAFSCKFCAKSFSRRAAMLSHELRHTQERRVPCDECEKLFYTVNQMDTHKRKVHNKTDDASLPFQCSLCTNRYRSASMLSTHKFKKHYKTAKIFCEQCDKKFIDEAQLEEHKTIHIRILK